MTTTEPQPTSRTPRTGRRNRRRVVTFAIIFCVLCVALCAGISQFGLWKASTAIEARQQESAKRWLLISGICWPRNAEWYFLSAITCRRDEEFNNVESHLRKALELGWRVSDLEREQTLAMAQTGQFSEVGSRWGELFQRAGSDGPEICKAYVSFALSRFRLDEAATVIEGWKRDFPNDCEPFLTEGRINSVLLQWKRAETSFRTAVELAPENDAAHIQLAQALIKQLQFSEAEKHLRAVSDESAETPEVIAALAHCMAQQGQTDESLLSLQNACKTHPKNLQLLTELGKLQLMRGQNEEAVAALSPVLRETPENTEIRYALAQALRNAGKTKKADTHFKLVDEGTKALRKLSSLTELIMDDPTDVESRFEIGAMTLRWKSRRDGLAWLKSVLELAPNHQPTHELLSEHYQASGNTERAEYHRQMSGVNK